MDGVVILQKFSSSFSEGSGNKLFAEFAGVFAISFCAISASIVVGSPIAPLAAGLAAAFAYYAASMAFYGISGAQFNPAITLSLYVLRKMPGQEALSYLVVQLLGSIMAALISVSVFGARAVAGFGFPYVTSLMPWSSAVLLESALTFLIALTYLAMHTSKRATFEISSTIAALMVASAVAASFVTGAVLNPARTFGAALVSNAMQSQSVYWFGPFLGAFVAALFYDYVIREKKVHGLEV